MGVSKHTWDAAGVINLEPFVFNPGPVVAQDVLLKEADRRVRGDRRLEEALKTRKAQITQVLQGCLDQVNDQIERGDDICKKAHFPLLNPFDFEDLESLANHDFTIDLHADEVDQALKEFAGGLLDIVWSNTPVENPERVKALERFNDALQCRMETLEHHLNDRSRCLSGCRLAYFHEITHLRNQLYAQQKEGVAFVASEAYYFDPLEYLEQELREELNKKISMSIKKYEELMNELKAKNERLELELEGAGGHFDPTKSDDLSRVLQVMCVKHGTKTTIETMSDVATKEMRDWAAAWAAKEGLVPDKGDVGPAPDVEKQMSKLREALMRQKAEAEEERRLREEAQDELEKLRAQLEAANESNRVSQQESAERQQRDITVVGANLGDTERIDDLLKQIAMLKIELAKEQEKLQEAEQRAEELERRVAQAEAEKDAAAQQLAECLNELSAAKSQADAAGSNAFEGSADRDRCKALEKLLAEAKAALEASETRLAESVKALAREKAREKEEVARQSGAKLSDEEREVLVDYRKSRKSLAAAFYEFSDTVANPTVERRYTRKSLRKSTVGSASWSVGTMKRYTSRLSCSSDDGQNEQRMTHFNSEAEDVEADDQSSDENSNPGGDSGDEEDYDVPQRSLADYSKWAEAALSNMHGRVKELETQATELQQAIENANSALADASAKFAADAEAIQGLSTAEMQATIDDLQRQLQEALARLEEEAEVKKEQTRRRSSLVQRLPGVGGGFDCEVQTDITSCKGGGFYRFEYPPSDAELAMKVELEDITSCAVANFEATLDHIRAAMRPPVGQGSGFCSRGHFLRLLQAVRQRLVRHNELLQIVESLKRADLSRLLEGIHYLMESSLPDEDPELREAIFGRGFTQHSLDCDGVEFLAQEKRLDRLTARTVDVLLHGEHYIELGKHAGRRTYLVGGGGGGHPLVNSAGGRSPSPLGGGGAGGGLAARQRREFGSPSPRPPLAVFDCGLADTNDSIAVEGTAYLALSGETLFPSVTARSPNASVSPRGADVESGTTTLMAASGGAVSAVRMRASGSRPRTPSATVLRRSMPEDDSFSRPGSANSNAGVGGSLARRMRASQSGGALVNVPQLGATSAEAERNIERSRRMICSGAAGQDRPMPTEVFEEMENARSRPVGGRHTTGGRIFAATPDLKRATSAGRIRPVGRSTVGSQATGQVSSFCAAPAVGAVLSRYLPQEALQREPLGASRGGILQTEHSRASQRTPVAHTVTSNQPENATAVADGGAHVAEFVQPRQPVVQVTRSGRSVAPVGNGSGIGR